MAEQRLEELVRRLHSMTAQGKIQWETTVSDAEFQASFPTYAVRVLQRGSLSGSNHILNIYNDKARLIDSAKSSGASSPSQDQPSTLSREASSLLEDIYSMARRSALHADEAIDTLLEALNG